MLIHDRLIIKNIYMGNFNLLQYTIYIKRGFNSYLKKFGKKH